MYREVSSYHTYWEFRIQASKEASVSLREQAHGGVQSRCRDIRACPGWSSGRTSMPNPGQEPWFFKKSCLGWKGFFRLPREVRPGSISACDSEARELSSLSQRPSQLEYFLPPTACLLCLINSAQCWGQHNEVWGMNCSSCPQNTAWLWKQDLKV